MTFLIIFIVSWFALGYLAARMVVLQFNEVDFMAYAFLLFGYIGWCAAMVASDGKGVRRKAHFIPKFPTLPKPSQKLQGKFFGVRIDD